jgi:hypothetical protein
VTSKRPPFARDRTPAPYSSPGAAALRACPTTITASRAWGTRSVLARVRACVRGERYTFGTRATSYGVAPLHPAAAGRQPWLIGVIIAFGARPGTTIGVERVAIRQRDEDEEGMTV